MLRSRGSISRFTPFFFSLILTLYSYIGIKFWFVDSLLIPVFVFAAPGFLVSYRLSHELDLSLDEFLVITIIFSGVVLMFLYLALTCMFAYVAPYMVFGGLTCFLFVLGFLVDVSTETLGTIDDETIKGLGGLLASYFLGFWVISCYMPLQYWRGPDGWENINVFRKISEMGLSPVEAYNFFRCYVKIPNPGFYYYFSVLHLMTGFSVESIMRYGGMIQTGVFVSLAYITFKRVNGLLSGLSGVFLLVLNPYFNHRFMVLLREEFSLFFFFTGLFLYICNRESGDWSYPLRIMVMGSLLASCMVSHPMVPVFFIGLLVCRMGYSFIERKFDEITVELYSLVLSLILVLPFLNIMLDPLGIFMNKISLPYLLIGSCLVIVVISSMYLIYYQKIDVERLIPTVQKVMIVLMFFLPLLGVTVKPNLGESYSFGFIDIEDFSKILVPLSVAGYFLHSLGRMEKNIVGLNLITVILIALSYLRIPLPLDRLSIPLIWLMSFYASYLVNASKQASFHETASITQDSELVSNLLKHRMTLVFILMIFAGGVLELSTITRKLSTFDASCVEDTNLFVSELEPGELVFPYGTADHMLYYANIPQDNIVADLEVKNKLALLLDQDSIYEISELVQESYPEVNSLIFYVDSWYENDLREKPFCDLLELYFEKAVRGCFSSYGLEIPFTVEKLKLNQVRYIKDFPEDPLFGSHCNITATSNILTLPDEEASYKFMFLSADADGTKYIGLASSTNGLDWNIDYEDKLGYELESIGLIERDDRYYLYAGTSSKVQVVRLDSNDLRNWGNYTIVIDSSSRDELVFIESPLVWQEESGFRMLWWETTIGDSMMNGVHYATSIDGANWVIEHRSLEWALLDSRYRANEYDKILPYDLMRIGEGIIILARMHKADGFSPKKWVTGSITLEDVTSKAAEVQGFVYKDHIESEMDSIHVIRDLDGVNLRFIYLEYCRGRVYIGAASDHYGVEK